MRLKKNAAAAIYHVLIAAFGLLMIYPVIWLLSSSLKDNSEVFVNAASLIPTTPKFSNYYEGWRGFGGVSFATFFRNSFILVALGTAGTLVSSTMIAYGFARIRFRGKRFWFICMMLTMMLPSQVQIIPQYILFNKINWINTFNPIIIPSFFGNAFFVFLIMQFIQGIPMDLDESAKIDGCNKYLIFIRIICPLIVPALITVIIFSFYWKWDDFFSPLLYLNKPSLYPVSLALKMFADPNSVSNWSAMFAMSVLALIPVFSVFVVFQRFLVEGISSTGLKA